MKRLLICGAAGMVGQALVNEALNYSDEFEIWAADMNVDVFADIKKPLFHAIQNKDLENTLSGNHFDAMLQLAFPRNVDPALWAGGIAFCFDSLWLAYKYNVDVVVHVSSQSLYGWQRDSAADEKSPILLTSPYTTGKFCTELLVRKLFDRGTNVRLSTIIGPLTNERVVNKFITQVIQGRDIFIKWGGQKFSFLDVRDAATGLLAILNAGKNQLSHVYNLGTREHTTLIDIAELIVKEGKKRGFSNTKVIVEPSDIIMNNEIIVSKIKDEIGWEAQYKLNDSIMHIFDYQIQKL